jgi:hypothetical protein
MGDDMAFKKPEGDKQTKKIPVAVTPTKHEQYTRMSEKTGIPLAEIARNAWDAAYEEFASGGESK